MLFVTDHLRSRSTREADATNSACCSQSPGSFSQRSVATLGIGALARCNQERAERIRTILNAQTSPSFCEDPEQILQSFLEGVSHRQLQQSLPGKTVPPNELAHRQSSETSLNCETAFQPIPSSVS